MECQEAKMGEKLGQHFLISERKLRKASESLDLKDGDTVIEIGPGHGELTKELRIQNSKCGIICIEKDRELASGVKSLKLGNFEVIGGDALKILPEIAEGLKSYKIAGNIPYYITGHLFRVIGDLKNKPEICVFTVQKEVAERICSEPPRMNLLAASVRFWANPKIASYVPKKYFRPEPKVDSAILELRIKDEESRIKEKYYKLIKILFKQPRKTVLNNLASGFKGEKKEKIVEKLEKAGINSNDRPQNAEVRQLIELSTLF